MPKAVSIGSHLRAIREEKGIALAEVSAETRLTPTTLAFLEDDNWARLPEPAYVKGFVKAYAKAVGADMDEALAVYTAATQSARPAEKTGFQALASSAWLMQLAFLAAFTLLVAILVFMVCLPGGDTEWNPGAASPMPTATPAVKREKPLSAVLRLKIEAKEDTWVRVMADGVEIRRFDLKRSQIMDVNARREFNILMGNPAAIRLSLDGKPVPVASRGGQAVNVKLP